MSNYISKRKQALNVFINTFILSLNMIFISCSSGIVDDIPSTPANEPPAFLGYKVSTQAKILGPDYWKNTGVLADLMIVAYQKPIGTRTRYNTFLNQLACGDFNNDGWIDIFNPGASYNGVQGGLAFLIWNPSKKIFEEQNLLKDQTITSFDGNKVKTIPFYFNNDDYVDLILFTEEDEGNFFYSPKKLKLLLSDGTGKYEVMDISHISPEISAGGGDVGDLNGDKIPDLILTYGSAFKILWGKSSSPYFQYSSTPMFSYPIVNLIGGQIVNFTNDNGFGETCSQCMENNIYDVSIVDINKDGWNDLVFQQPEFNNDPNNVAYNRILINKGSGRFNNSSVIKLPKFDTASTKTISQEDYIFDDINGDGKLDIIALNEEEYKSWNIFVYLQKSSGDFELKKDWIQYTINSTRKGFWKAQLIYYDFNKDGLKDISYLDAADNGESKYKSVFIRKGNAFVEEDFYQYDTYAKSVMQKINY